MDMERIAIQETGVQSQMERFTFGQGTPHLFFTAGIHGNEVTGVYVARRLIAYLQANPLLKGKVSVIPVVNAAGMRCMTRCNPFDRLDLNRVFPGDPEGTFGRRLAAAVYAATADADLLVDLHCCGQHGLPYLLSVYSESEKVRRLVSQITMPVAVHSEGTAGQLFTESTRSRDQAACIIELPSGTCGGAVNQPVGDQCFEALLDLLRAQGMIAGPARGQGPAFYGKLLDALSPPDGLWQPAIQRGDRVTAGQVIGHTGDTPVTAPADGMVMAVLPCSYLMEPGQWVMTYVQPEEPARG